MVDGNWLGDDIITVITMLTENLKSETGGSTGVIFDPLFTTELKAWKHNESVALQKTRRWLQVRTSIKCVCACVCGGGGVRVLFRMERTRLHAFVCTCIHMTM